MTRQEYESLRHEINERHRLDLEALDRVWGIAQLVAKASPSPYRLEPPSASTQSAAIFPAVPASQPPGYLPQPPASDGSRMDVMRFVREILPSLPDEFTVHDAARLVIDKHQDLAETLNRSSVTTALNRLVEVREIGLVQAGAGKRASRFSRTPQTQEAQ